MPALLSPVRADFEGEPVGSHPPARPGWAWHRVAADRTTVITSPRNPRVGTRALRMVRRRGDVYASGQRCELHHSAGDRERHGTEAWYATSFHLPAPGGNDAAWDPEAEHALVWQVHHAGNNGPPPLSLMASRYWNRSNAISLHFQVYGGPANRPTINHLFLTPTRSGSPDVRGHWWEVRWGVGWREDATGWIEADIRRGDQTEWTPCGRLAGIPTWLAGDPGGYRKFGAYFGGSDREQVVYHHGYARGATRGDVTAWFTPTTAPDPAPTPDPDPDPAPVPRERITPALAVALRTDLTAIRNRLTTVTGYQRLTESQRAAVEAVRTRADLALTRIDQAEGI